ncbi:MAG: hypothetical protein ACQR33_03660 [Candidatus Saccharibacteria bacterium]
MSEVLPGECPFDPKAMQRELWAQHRESYDSLRDIFDPLTAEIATSLEEMANHNPQEITMRSEYYPVTARVPFDTPRGLPPTLFMGSKDIAELPSSKHAAKRLANEHMKYADSLSDILDGVHPAGDSFQIIRERLVEYSKQGTTLNTEAWEEYEAAYAHEAARGLYVLGNLAMHRELNISNFERRVASSLLPESNQARYFSYTTSGTIQHGEQIQNMAMVMLPIGAYGAKFTNRLVRSTAVMIDHAVTDYLPLAKEYTSGKDELLRDTARGGDVGKAFGYDEGALSTIGEGILSIAQTVALLTAEKVPGYETGDELLSAIIEQGVVNDVTRLLMLGLIGPLTLGGKYFPGLLQANPDGKLTINPDIRAKLEALRENWMVSVYKNWHNEPAKNRAFNGGFGLVCPANTPRGGITALSKAFQRVHALSSSDTNTTIYGPWRIPGHRFNVDTKTV